MADFNELKAIIEEAIRENGREEITGDILQGVLLSIVDKLGDEEINNLYQAISDEIGARQGADNTLQGNIDAEELRAKGAERTNAEAIAAEEERAKAAERVNAQAIADEETRAKAAEKANADDIDIIEAKIPTQASSENQLADKAYVDDKVATDSATFRGAFNQVTDLELSVDATHAEVGEAIAVVLAALIPPVVPDNNDYCYVQVPDADATPTEIERVDRYKFNGTDWVYEYSIINSGFTAAQWAALNSGITSGLVAKLRDLPTNAQLTTLLNGKEAINNKVTSVSSSSTDTQYPSAKAVWTTITAWLSGAMSWTAAQMKQARANLGFGNGDIDDVPTAESNNVVKSGGVQSELALGAVYDVSAKNPTAGPNNDGKWASLSALLSDANLNTLIPSTVRKGGMSIKYVQSSDNNYMQCRLMTTTFSTNVSDWFDICNDLYGIGYLNIPTADLISCGYYIDGWSYSMGKWITNSYYYGAIIDVTQHRGKYVFINGNENLSSHYSFLKSGPVLDAVPDYATGFTTILSRYSTIECIPDDAVYLYIVLQTGAGNIRRPDKIVITSKGFLRDIILKINDTNSRINALDNKYPVIDNAADDFSIKDESRNAVVQFLKGHIKTKNFDSRNIDKLKVKDVQGYDFGVEDENGKSIVSFAGGHIKTKNFDSAKINNKDVVMNNFDMLFSGSYSADGSTTYPSFNLLHFSDIHGGQTNLERIVAFKTKYQDIIADALHTGDNVTTEFSDGMAFWSGVNGAESILNCIGNHDTHTVSPWDWWAKTPAEAYQAYFAPFIDGWGLTENVNYVENLCYYYKDYSDSKIRLIVLDGMYYDNTQNTWFAGVLADAITKGLYVICANHFSPYLATKTKNSFDSFMGYATDVNMNGQDYIPDSANGYRLVQQVDTFINNGGHFVCWLAGHTHRDFFSILTNHPNQICIHVPSANVENGTTVDFYRDKNDYTMDCFNVISVNVTYKILSILRVGADYDCFGRHKGVLVWDFENKQLIFNN